ncbi:hypothetical protein GCM10009665_49350 [Kitasatospora nipponensis]|uniref:SIS domain-containing protein n=1 Tax=Kitasatospora nipponensis TaxID=258049 RepID=A0ABP4H865_9ACTN
MDPLRVSALRQGLAGTELLAATRAFAGSLRGAVTRRSARGLLLVGSDGYEPWHLAAHLDEEAAWSDLPLLAPTLIRHRPEDGGPAVGGSGPEGALPLGTVPAVAPPAATPPPHLRHGLPRLAAAGRGETVLVVSPQAAGAGLLERLADARRGGATVLALAADDRADDGELTALAHRSLTVDSAAAPEFDLVQHLVSAAAGEQPRRTDRLARLVARFTTEPVNRW